MSSRGFTLIELLIVVSLTVILSLAASALFLTSLVSSSKGNALQTVKTEGEYALSQIEFIIRNGLEILPNSAGITCDNDMSELKIRSIDQGTTTFLAETVEGVNKIASNSGIYLTSDSVTLVSGPKFDCKQSIGTGTPYVTVQFTLRKGTPGLDDTREIVERDFQTSVNLRSY